MIKNPVVPYAIIAVIGILMVVVFSYIGDSQRKAMNEEENGTTAESEEIGEPDEIYANKCASCHGDDLSGVSGPDLTQVGDRLSEEDIHDIIVNGSDNGQMPGGLTSVEEADALAEWLADMK
ncbi:MAG TPA: cytochrome c [Bacillota bacterium]|nr:cytochrome c [Bacillota bacterium]